MEEQKTELKMIRMSEVESQEVKWLWYPFIPYGKLTIIQGDSGDGRQMKRELQHNGRRKHCLQIIRI